mmetsp:Transcript_10855/g.20995  ORF Transcript_10855/g.20995 Transcript_10855/m.20995 type:complete len:277 (+) Transcript_10855:1258-2088(+)
MSTQVSTTSWNLYPSPQSQWKLPGVFTQPRVQRFAAGVLHSLRSSHVLKSDRRENPDQQRHWKDPCVFTQSCSQSSVPIRHSSASLHSPRPPRPPFTNVWPLGHSHSKLPGTLTHLASTGHTAMLLAASPMTLNRRSYSAHSFTSSHLKPFPVGMVLYPSWHAQLKEPGVFVHRCPMPHAFGCSHSSMSIHCLVRGSDWNPFGQIQSKPASLFRHLPPFPHRRASASLVAHSSMSRQEADPVHCPACVHCSVFEASSYPSSHLIAHPVELPLLLPL